MSVERQLMMCAGGATQQYTISNSLRFRASASAYLSRTPASAGNQTTWTWSGWVKRGGLGAAQSVLFFADSTTSNYAGILFASDVIEFVNRPTAGINARLITTQVFRDPSAWYHIVGVWDSSNATSGDRVRLYVNGTRVTAFSTATYPSISTTSIVNTATAHEHGSYVASNGGTPAAFFDGYLTEINFIDGQALTPSSFGETSSTTGVWIPKKYTGSYGTNGFYLNFSNNTSTTALGYDTSGNGNNWTPNNFSLTTGSTYDSMIDSPTSYASGTNNVGNYAVLNPLNPPVVGSIANANSSFQRDSQGGVARNTGATGTFGISSGKWYFELIFTAIGSNNGTSGTADDIFGVISTTAPNDIGIDYQAYSLCWCYQGNGNKSNGSSVAYGNSLSEGDIVGVALDLNSGKIFFSKNGTWQASGDPAAGTNAAFTNLSGYSVTSVVACYNNNLGPSRVRTANFGQRPFAYTPPSGYNALNTYNLSTPSIVDGSKQFAASLYTGTGSSLSVSGANFTPGMVWIKSRSAATDHALYDVIRGTQARLESNTTDTEVTSDNGVTAFNSTGFTVGTLAQVNTSSATYVGWQWKANGTAVTNTAGSITSSVSANTTAGFSVVTYTGTGANATVGHGLGIAPNMMILKRRSVGAEDWAVYHSSLANAATTLALNNTAAAVGGNATTFNSTAPTSTVFSLGTNDRVNTSSVTYVAYCFAAIAGYSAFGSYTGNGSSDGPFIYTGFRPRYVLIKKSSATQDWVVLDTARSPYNASLALLYPDLSNVEDTDTGGVDILSNGFKPRRAADYNNASGATYIYAAFCEVPFNFSLAR